MMFEQNLRIGEQVVFASNESSGPYTVAPIENAYYHITWRYVTSSSSSEVLTEEGYYIPGHADRILTVEEYATLRELLNNHPGIRRRQGEGQETESAIGIDRLCNSARSEDICIREIENERTKEYKH